MLSTQIFGGKDLNLGKGEMNFAFIRRFPNLDNAFFWIFCTFGEKVKAISVKLEMKRASSIDETHSGYSRIYNIFAGARTQHFVIAE